MEKEVGKEVTQKLTSSPHYYQQPETQLGKPFFVFTKPGDFIKGELVGKSGNRAIFRSTSYAMKVEAGRLAGEPLKITDGQVEEFFGNAQLHRIISKNELMHSIVKIVYIGKYRHPKALHAMKVYRVYKESGVFKTKEEQKLASTPKRRPFRGRERNPSCQEKQSKTA
jgi:hypothetical protein